MSAWWLLVAVLATWIAMEYVALARVRDALQRRGFAVRTLRDTGRWLEGKA